MKLQIAKAELVPDKFGKHIEIKMVKLLDDNDKYIKFVKLNEDIIEVLKSVKIEIGKDYKC
jgi:hypothetical protein